MNLSNLYTFGIVYTEWQITINHQLTYIECLLHTYKTLTSTCTLIPLGGDGAWTGESACLPRAQPWVSCPAWQQMNKNPISTLPGSWYPLALHTRKDQDRVHKHLAQGHTAKKLWPRGISSRGYSKPWVYHQHVWMRGTFTPELFFNLYIVPLITVRARVVIMERSGWLRRHWEGEGETDQTPCRAGWTRS